MIVVFIRRNARWLLRPTVLDGLLLAEMDGLNNVIKEYIYLAGQLLAVRDFSRGFGEMYYAHTDHLGMPRLLTNNIGQTAWRGEFDPFGKTVSINEDVDGDGFNVTLNIRFPGQYYDAETGLHYNWHRYYDPEIGQYTSVDPIGLAGGLNVYTYVGGNPVMRFDPDGLTQEQINAAIKFARKYNRDLKIPKACEIGVKDLMRLGIHVRGVTWATKDEDGAVTGEFRIELLELN